MKGTIQTPDSQNSPDQQSAFQININQRLAIQHNNNQYPIFQTTLNQQSAFQPSSDEQPASDLNSHKQSAFQSDLYQQQPASNSNSHKQSIFQSDLYQQQPVFHPNYNQQSTPGINTGLEVASNRSSQIGPRMSATCGYCGKRFADDAALSKHKNLTCRYQLWFFCPEPNCRFHRDKEVGFQLSIDLWLHVSAQHNYSQDSQFFLTYRGEMRDLGRIGGWRAP